MAATVDCYLFLISPYSYLGNERFRDIVRRHGATAVYKPVDQAALYAATGGIPVAKRAPQRQAYRLVEMARWRDFLGMPLNLQPRHFPVDDSLAAGMVIAAQDEGRDAGPLVTAILRACWAEERDVSDRATLADIATACGFAPEPLLRTAALPETQAKRQTNTEEAITRGVFGAPFYWLGDEPFWGQDRLDFLDRALANAG